jgi:hypothetical protein
MGAPCFTRGVRITPVPKGFKLPHDQPLQGFLSIATKFIATAKFCCNKMRYYHKIHGRGNRIHILPHLSFVALSTIFVAIEATYCNKMHCCCNMVAILQQFCCVAQISHFIAIATKYYNKINFHGNT